MYDGYFTWLIPKGRQSYQWNHKLWENIAYYLTESIQYKKGKASKRGRFTFMVKWYKIIRKVAICQFSASASASI
jgi:hypothetical protein